VDEPDSRLLGIGMLGRGPARSSACQITNPSDHLGEFAEATPNRTLALTVLGLAVVLPCLPALSGLAAQVGIPASVTIGLDLLGSVAVVVKWASIAYGIGRYSTA
jgi:hypothetical protein